MKKILFKIPTLIFGIFIQQAFAAVTVTSSSPTFYACNGGIRHAESSATCVDSGTNATCVPSSSNVSSCVCTSEASAGAWAKDQLSSTYADWIDSSTPIGSTSTDNIIALNDKIGFNTLFLNDSVAFTKQMTAFNINLGSEVYGAEYFVDICYQGPQGTTQNNNGTNYSLNANITLTNIRTGMTNAPDYQSLANLQVKADIKCFLDKSNTSSLVVPGLTKYNYFQNSGTSYVSLSSSATQLTILTNSGLLNIAGDKIPRFCIARYYLKENSTLKRSWKMGAVRASIFTEIVDKNGN
jgi:hypothetical protein